LNDVPDTHTSQWATADRCMSSKSKLRHSIFMLKG
jgi:hypothetical protein